LNEKENCILKSPIIHFILQAKPRWPICLFIPTKKDGKDEDKRDRDKRKGKKIITPLLCVPTGL
jgi:hypothetical protein